MMIKAQLSGMEKFFSALKEETNPLISRILNDRKTLVDMGKFLFDEPREAKIDLVPSPKEKSILKLFFGYSEIDAAIQVLKDIPFYIKRFPSKSPNVSKKRFLNYHIGNYLNEIYILRERLVAYQKVITRMYKYDRRLPEMGKYVKRLKTLVSGFNGIIATRRKHVHQARYDDDDLDRLSIFERMTKEDDPHTLAISEFYPLVLREYRNKWIERISINNDGIKEILDIYFEILYEVVFDKNGNWINPISS